MNAACGVYRLDRDVPGLGRAGDLLTVDALSPVPSMRASVIRPGGVGLVLIARSHADAITRLDGADLAVLADQLAPDVRWDTCPRLEVVR